MSAEGSTPAARAWSDWARPISDPSPQTAALFDMFWALNGATRHPRRANIRQNAAVSRLLPTWDAVPWIISVRAIARFSPWGVARSYRRGRLPV